MSTLGVFGRVLHDSSSSGRTKGHLTVGLIVWQIFQGGTVWDLRYGIPAAIAISSNYSQWTSHVQSHRLMWYWWVPDSTFIELAPEPMIFPRHSPSGWAKGDKVSWCGPTHINVSMGWFGNFFWRSWEVYQTTRIEEASVKWTWRNIWFCSGLQTFQRDIVLVFHQNLLKCLNLPIQP